MSGISQIEAVKTAQEIYKLLTDFSVLYDVWIVETVFDALYCALEALQDVSSSDKYQSGRKRVGDIRERMAR
jgi:hypothetical protein